ncbi:putative esterase [Corynebacterium camporealensis]|uniref:Putative esterase n=1 Tax=Corynebacterium camporealensis TaxID=161896 RepID=A0A0F6TC73_9CORY|nr:alpha/beta hydrolase family protein [Corynebacterium camporealensis]AKE40076.1 putative esterase [Corynebacterium camporealensis]AVH89156.1 putative esterase [Corynebacterium camporealensis]
MNASTSALKSRVLAVLTAIAVAMGMAYVAGTPQAQAAPRDYLRHDSNGMCTWDPVMYYVQRCDVWSESMGRHIPVQIQPAKNGGNAGLYLLDGLRARNDTNAWVKDVNAAKTYEHHNITLVMPVGGEASFYQDWRGPATYDLVNPVNYKWETFLTSELPGYLERNFGVARNNNSIAGLSMGGTAAITLAGKHPNQFRQALSYSGYLTTSIPGAHTFMRLALLDAGGYNINAMYGTMISPQRFENDPFMQIQNLRNTDVYISAASGIPGPGDASYLPQHRASGAVLEGFANVTTRAFEVGARVQGVNVTTNYPGQGLHNWKQFGYQLERSKPQVLNVMNAW